MKSIGIWILLVMISFSYNPVWSRFSNVFLRFLIFQNYLNITYSHELRVLVAE